MRLENVYDELDDFPRVEWLANEREDAVAHRPQVEQVLHERLQERQLADNELDIADDFGVDVGSDEHLQDLLHEE